MPAVAVTCTTSPGRNPPARSSVTVGPLTVSAVTSASSSRPLSPPCVTSVVGVTVAALTAWSNVTTRSVLTAAVCEFAAGASTLTTGDAGVSRASSNSAPSRRRRASRGRAWPNNRSRTPRSQLEGFIDFPASVSHPVIRPHLEERRLQLPRHPPGVEQRRV